MKFNKNGCSNEWQLQMKHKYTAEIPVTEIRDDALDLRDDDFKDYRGAQETSTNTTPELP